jgi:hypothetical protein
VLVHCRKGLTCRVRASVANAILLANIAVLVLLLAGGTASAQNGIFDTILGRRAAPAAPAAAPVSAYADPFSAWNLFGSPGPQPLQPLMDTAVAYCVRLCDGRFFPVQRHEGAAPEQTCSSFCPATRTKIYSGASIDQAVAADGRRYADLSTAFAYREKLVDGCTCNGRTAFGLVNTSVKDDPTLRAGDIVATNTPICAASCPRPRSRRHWRPRRRPPTSSRVTTWWQSARTSAFSSRDSSSPPPRARVWR